MSELVTDSINIGEGIGIKLEDGHTPTEHDRSDESSFVPLATGLTVKQEFIPEEAILHSGEEDQYLHSMQHETEIKVEGVDICPESDATAGESETHGTNISFVSCGATLVKQENTEVAEGEDVRPESGALAGKFAHCTNVNHGLESGATLRNTKEVTEETDKINAKPEYSTGKCAKIPVEFNGILHKEDIDDQESAETSVSSFSSSRNGWNSEFEAKECETFTNSGDVGENEFESKNGVFSPHPHVAPVGNNISLSTYYLDQPHDSKTYCYDSYRIKLIDVSVVLEDLFQNVPRDDSGRLARRHTNSKLCACVFCTRKFRLQNGSNNSVEIVINRNIKDSNSYSGHLRKLVKGKCNRTSKSALVEYYFSHSVGDYQKKSKGKFRSRIHSRTAFGTKNELEQHNKVVHLNTQVFVCLHCNTAFKSKKSLKDHLLYLFREKPYVCDQCHSAFKSKSKLEVHSVVHSTKKPYVCDQCHSAFSTKSNVKRHLAVHSTERPYSCAHCQSAFKTIPTLKSHLRVHSTARSYSCKQCPLAFVSKSKLTEHLVVHSTEKCHSCDQCHSAFKTKFRLMRHLVVHSTERPYSCVQCQSAFKTMPTLKQHLLEVHSIAKSYSCKQCDLAFNSKSKLKRHLAVHSTERPHSCDQCHFAFKTRSILKQHSLAVHSTERPHSCNHCHFAFKQKHHLERHLIRHPTCNKSYSMQDLTNST